MYIPNKPWSLAINIYKLYGAYLESFHHSNLINFCLCQVLNQGPSVPEADDIPICHRASLHYGKWKVWHSYLDPYFEMFPK